MKCLDTYALIEICNGNPAFVDLLREEVVITDITLAEFYGNLYRKYGLKTAEYWNRKLSPFCRPVPREILIQAIRFRIDHKDKNLSFFDCVGYLYALEERLLFVTGDKEFKQLKGTDFRMK
ncbi:MAG TPA: PIN domain-containing protein [Candidatus Nanoarchaeia archaeon]|nr:PIN domain-containing protein [Candidatus Nanoarchaeia archaeon]